MRAFGREIALVSFDLDDTLVDSFGSVPARARAALQALPPAFRPSPGAIERVAIDVATGDPLLRPDRLLAGAGLPRGTREATDLLRAYAANDELIGLIDGASAVLECIASRVPVIVISNGETAIQMAKLRRHGLERFVTALITSDAFGVGKPDPRIFDHAAAVAGVLSSSALHVGDSLATDVLGANAAGWASIHFRSPAPNPKVTPPPQPTATIDRLVELSALLELD